jgi:hypothetical protein
MNTNINRAQLGYALLVVLFLAYLINANNIVAYFVGDSVKVISFDKFPKKDKVEFSIDESYVSGGLEGNIYFKGWAFCETGEENDSKKIGLIFVSDNISYIYNLKAVGRADLKVAFSTSKEIKGIMHGFAGEFSTIIMKNGIYKLYIYDWENENNYGIVDTGKLYKKDAIGIEEFTWTSSEIDLDLRSSVQRGLASNIEIFNNLHGDLLNVEGWAFVNEMDCKNQKVYIEIIGKSGSKTYDTISCTRYDVRTAYQNEMYEQSGFKAQIPIAGSDNGEITINIYIENDGTIYRTDNSYKYSLDI